MIKECKLGSIEIQFSESVLRVLTKYKQIKKAQPESGGILFGQVKGNVVYLMKASVPNQFDTSSRTSFNRNKEIAQILISHEFVNSDNTVIYLGEWHSHPEEIPTPSSVDIAMIKDQFKQNKLNEPYIIFIIQGTKAIYLGMFDGEQFKGQNIYE